MIQGTIVKIATTKLFDEKTMLRNKSKWVYGTLSYLEDMCEETGEKAWQIMWATQHLYVTMDTFNPVLPQLERDLVLVLHPGAKHIRIDKNYKTSDFFEEENGLWKVRDYEAFCEYCKETNCDRMNYREDLDHAWWRMTQNTELTNNKKRKFIYCSFINDKYGYLGCGRRMRVPKCVCKYAGDMFPPLPGEPQMGHRDE